MLINRLPYGPVLATCAFATLVALGRPAAPPPASPRGQDAPVGERRPARQAPTDLTNRSGCSTSDCHAAISQGEYIHGPVAVQDCHVCHTQADPSRHEFASPEQAASSCAACHELSLRDITHRPVADGNCTGCHDPHSSAAPALIKSENLAELCGTCHEQAHNEDKKFVHGPVAAGACNLCHDAHSSYYEHLMNKQGAASCLSCHAEMEQDLRLARHWHRPVSEDCALCHDAHASNHAFQLKDEPQTLCLDCHQDKKSEMESARVFHEALTTADGCKNCHNTHASRFPKLLDRPVLEICLGCHDKPQVRKDGTVVTAMGRELADSKYLHGPIREGDCSSCHNPHGAANFSLLRESYPQRFYAPFEQATYRLCFRCHDAKVFTEPQTTTLTSFRNGDLNLHYLHVNRDTKGRTCRACHMTHGSNLPQHIAEQVPFGGWEIPINYRDYPTGGSCAPGCHKEKSYDFVTALPGFERAGAGAPTREDDR